MFFKIKALSRPVQLMINCVRGRRLVISEQRLPLTDDVSLCVLGNGAEGNPRSVVLTYNEKTFLFNCGEGTQRRLSDFGFKSSQMDHLLLTSTNFANISGLSSLLLCCVKSGINDFTISGPECRKLLQTATRFDTKCRKIKFHFTDAYKSIIYEDLEIKRFQLKSMNHPAVLYVGQLKARKNLIDLEKCFHSKVPRHLVKVLENGDSITLDSGQVIEPSMVSAPEEPERRFAIIECTSGPVLSSILCNNELMKLLKDCEVIVHFCNEWLFQKPEYQKLVEASPKQKHLLLRESNPSISLYSAHRFQLQLNILDPKVFPTLPEIDSLSDIETKADNYADKSKRLINCISGSSLQLRPSAHSDDEHLMNKSRIPEEILQNVLIHKDGSGRDGFNETLEELRTAQQKLTPKGASFPEFVFLGTTSSMPTSIRNASGILVNLSPSESILLDCGENTYGQLLRFYGREWMPRVMSKLKAVFISHHHSDHQMGLIEIINRHHNYTGERLQVIAPPFILNFLKSLSLTHFERLKKAYDPVYSSGFLRKGANEAQRVLECFKSMRNIDLFPVKHCAFAFGIVIQDAAGFRFVYSGDTEPCDNLRFAAKDCDLLIHEATVEDSLQRFARMHFHTTFSEAVNIAKKTRSKFTILTHFSQRYAKLPYLPSVEDNAKIAIAFDNMRVCPADFERLPLLRNALESMYSKHLTNLEYKSLVYERRHNTRKESIQS